MASTDARPIPIKNTAFRVTFGIFDADGDLVTGATGLDSEVSKDGGTFADCTNEATEIATSSGMYYLDLTSTEMNADCVAIIVKTSSSGAKTTPIVLYPAEGGDIDCDVTYWNGTAVSSPATAGIPEVNVKNINNVATTSVTTVSAYQGTTQPINFTGTGASASAKSDIIDIAGSAVSTSTAQLGVNVVNFGGSAGTFASGRAEVNATHLAGTAYASADLSATMKASVNTEADTALADAGVTTTRTGYLDKLNITGNVASSSEVTSIQNNTRMVFVVPEQIMRPTSGTTTVYVRLYLYDEIGNMEAPDSAPTMDLRNAAGTDLTTRLGSTTGTLESTGQYRWSYTASSTDTIEQILWALSVVEGGATRTNGRTSWVVDTYAADFTSSDRTTLNTIAGYTDSIAADVRTELTTELGRIDVATSTRLASASYTTPPTVGQIDTQLSGTHGAGSWATATGFSTLDASGVRTAVGLASANLDTQLSTIDTVVDAVQAKTDNLPASPAAVGSAMTLTTGERDSIAAALLDLSNGVETSVTVRGALRAIASAVAGVLSGAGGTGDATVTIKAIGNAGTTRLTVETDEDGNRTAVTLG